MADAYRIIIQPDAYDGMEAGYEYIEADSPENAHKWAVGLMDAIMSLEQFPSRCQLAPEDKFFQQEIRQLLYGKGRGIFRILFTIKEDAVSILHIRHSSQSTLGPDR